ncbi:MAG: hypothetical protein AAFN27_17590 [Pseudomonadota bacterium]
MIGFLKDLVRREPIAVGALVVSILAIVPLYVDYFGARAYSYTFKCAEIETDSLTIFVEGPRGYDFAAVHTRCDFSNTDNQTISVKRVISTGIWESISTYTYDFDRPEYGEAAETRLRLAQTILPFSVQPGEAFLFDEFYLIPIRKDWNDRSEACVAMETRQPTTMWEAGNCVHGLHSDNLFAYIETINFHGGGGGMHPFRDFGVRLELTDGTVVDERITYSWVFHLPERER